MKFWDNHPILVLRHSSNRALIFHLNQIKFSKFHPIFCKMHFKLIWNPLSALIPLYSLQSVHLSSVVRGSATSQREKREACERPMRALNTCLLTGALREEKTLHKSRLTPGDEGWVSGLTNERPGLVTSSQWEAGTVTTIRRAVTSLVLARADNLLMALTDL